MTLSLRRHAYQFPQWLVLSKIIACGFLFILTSNAARISHQADHYGYLDEIDDVEAGDDSIFAQASGYVQAAYFTDWGIYGANFQPSDINPTDLTHILYAFAMVSAETGAISLADSYADEQKHFPGDSWDEPGNNLYGCLKQLYLLKLSNRNLKVLFSVGGWTYSQNGDFSFVTDPDSRATFVSDAVQFIQNYGLDGIDIDFEYPSNAAQGQGFADLLTALRSAFDDLATANGDTVPYQLTAAVSAGWLNYGNYVIPQMDEALTYWNLMSYDYAGSWLNWTDNMANLYDGERTNVSTDKAIQYYFDNGATLSKINMGIPLYGRSFEATLGLGLPYNGIGQGTIEAGVYSYNVLPLPGAQVYENFTDVTSYSYDPVKQEFVSFDTPDIVKVKAQYAMDVGLAGSMFWDLSTDRNDSNSLVWTSADVYGELDGTPNHINFPNSTFDNIRSNMANGTATASNSITLASMPTPASGDCASIADWDTNTAYTGGQNAAYNGDVWSAKWWTQGDIPGGQTDAWTDNGPCPLSKR